MLCRPFVLPLVAASSLWLAGCSQPASTGDATAGVAAIPPAAGAVGAADPIGSGSVAGSAAALDQAVALGPEDPSRDLLAGTQALEAEVDAQAEVQAEAQVDGDIQRMLGDPAPYRVFIHQFQQAVERGDKPAVAALVRYPFRASIDGRRRQIRTAEEFVRYYDRIVTPDVAQVITSQRYPDLLVNWKGVMFGRGQAWIAGTCAGDDCAAPHVQVVAIGGAAKS